MELRLVELGHEPALGARPLRRAIPEGTTIKVGLDEEKFTFTG